MIIDTNITMAYKCSSCGTFNFVNKSIFEIEKEGHCHVCRCNKSNMSITPLRSGRLKLSVPCIACDCHHEYMLSGRDIFSKDIRIFNCPEKGIQQCFIGKDENVRIMVDNLQKEYDQLIDEFGYDSYFKNTQVMFDSLNKIHDLAEKGNLRCECGNTNIEMILLSDRIYLRCRKCSATKIISAASNEDLKGILHKQYINLFAEVTKSLV